MKKQNNCLYYYEYLIYYIYTYICLQIVLRNNSLQLICDLP